MAPCMRLRAWLGARLAEGGVPPHARADRIATCRAPSSAALADPPGGLLDRHAADTPGVRQARRRAMELELALFAAALRR